MVTGWRSKLLGETFKVVNGGTPKTGIDAYWDGVHQWITPAEMGGLASPYLASSRRTLTDEGLRVGAELVPAGSIILSTRAPIGHLVINEVPMAFNQGCKGLVPSSEIDTKFAYYFFLANVPVLESLGTGATFKELSAGKLKEVTFLYPALAEQRRIVAVLDQAFDAIDLAKANTEENLSAASALFEGHLHDLFCQTDDRWVTKPVQEWVNEGVLAKPQDGNHGEIHPTRADYAVTGVPFIMASDLVGGEVDTVGCRFISRERAEALRIGFAKSGDVLLSHKGTIGRVALLDTDHDFVMLTPQVTYYRVKDESRLFNGFLYYWLRSPQFQVELNRIAGGGSTRAYIGITRQLDLRIALPPVAAQRDLAARLKGSEAACHRYSELCRAKLIALDELRSSLLHQAFTGKLTAKSADVQVCELA